jgi:hypothetical protein
VSVIELAEREAAIEFAKAVAIRPAARQAFQEIAASPTSPPHSSTSWKRSEFAAK